MLMRFTKWFVHKLDWFDSPVQLTDSVIQLQSFSREEFISVSLYEASVWLQKMLYDREWKKGSEKEVGHKETERQRPEIKGTE